MMVYSNCVIKGCVQLKTNAVISSSVNTDDPLAPQNTVESLNDKVKDNKYVCRICLVDHPEDSVSLFSTFEDENIGQMMTYCTSLEVLNIL